MTVNRDDPPPNLIECYDQLATEVAEIKHVLHDVLGVLRGKSKSHYSTAEVAEAVDRSEYTIRSWIKGGLLRAVRVDGTGPRGRLLVPREELERLIQSGRGGSLPPLLAGDAHAAD